MTVYSDVQSLEPGEMVELFELDARAITGGGYGDILRFHGYTQIGPITWQGNEYTAWPIDTDGFELNPDQVPQPTLSVGNVDGSITALCLAYQDLVGALIKRHRTFGKYLDAANFPDGNAGSDPTQEFPVDQWAIERKSSESNDVVQWELSCPLDIGDQKLPARLVIANFCPWLQRGGYRGPYCGYTGPAVAQADDTPTTDPSKDRCGGRLSSCKLRQWPDGIPNFGGFPAAGLMRT